MRAASLNLLCYWISTFKLNYRFSGGGEGRRLCERERGREGVGERDEYSFRGKEKREMSIFCQKIYWLYKR